jgi:hypothetical protein
MIRGLFTEIRLDEFLYAKHFMFIGIVNQWLDYEGCSQKYDWTPSFFETLRVHWYYESMDRSRRFITEIRQDPFLYGKHYKLIGIVIQ